MIQIENEKFTCDFQFWIHLIIRRQWLRLLAEDLPALGRRRKISTQKNYFWHSGFSELHQIWRGYRLTTGIIK